MGKYNDNIDEFIALHHKGFTQRQIAKMMTSKYNVSFDNSRVGRALNQHPDYTAHRKFEDPFTKKDKVLIPEEYMDKVEKQMLDNGLTEASGAKWKHAWLKDKNGASIFVKNVSEVVSFDEMRADFVNEMGKYSPTYKTYKRKPITDKHLLVIDPADIHVNKKATEEETGGVYNSEIAVKRVKEAIEGILQKASGFPLEKIVLIIGNDVLNVDNVTNTTTRGTPQDVSNRWYEGFRIAKQMYVDVIESLLTVADVEVVHVMSNHDYVSGWMLADSISSWFRKSANITFDLNVRHRKYFKWGNNLIGLSHGDKFKAADAPLLMANEAPKIWGETYYRYFYLHHFHHQIKVKFQSAKDYQGVTVQHLRSPSPADLWHFDSGYTHAKQAIEAFIHHKKEGQVCCLTHNF
jgi:hypothetical protein